MCSRIAFLVDCNISVTYEYKVRENDFAVFKKKNVHLIKNCVETIDCTLMLLLIDKVCQTYVVWD